jgi:hypothetical protein
MGGEYNLELFLDSNIWLGFDTESSFLNLNRYPPAWPDFLFTSFSFSFHF